MRFSILLLTLLVCCFPISQAFPYFNWIPFGNNHPSNPKPPSIPKPVAAPLSHTEAHQFPAQPIPDESTNNGDSWVENGNPDTNNNDTSDNTGADTGSGGEQSSTGQGESGGDWVEEKDPTSGITDETVVRPINDGLDDFGNGKRRRNGKRGGNPRARRRFNRRFPKSCTCKQMKGPPGYCHEFIRRKSSKCIRRRCISKYVCVSKRYLKKYGRHSGTSMCMRRISRRRVVPLTRETWIPVYGRFRKGFCEYVRTRRMVFYIPYNGKVRSSS